MINPNRRLRQARELRGWSQAKVAEQVGTDATTVSRWERGLFFPTPYFRERLCTLFGKNAEELGLLDIASQSPERIAEHRTSTASTRDTVSLSPPSWSQRTDTFTYILQSAAHDEMAHTLWEDAYVRALQGQYVQAQELGEASLNAFEQVGHTNASALREWLSQRGLDVAHAPTTEKLATTHSVIAQMRKRKRAGFFLLLLLLGGLLSSGLIFGQLHPPALRSSSPPARQVHTNAQPLSSIAPVAHFTPLPDPTATATATATPGISMTPVVASRAIAKVTPAHLTSQSCASEPLGYRCTLTLSLFTDDQSGFTWQASSRGIAAQFNPASGSGSSGQPCQIIVYVQSDPTTTGTLVFSFTVSKHLYTAFVDWKDR